MPYMTKLRDSKVFKLSFVYVMNAPEYIVNRPFKLQRLTKQISYNIIRVYIFLTKTKTIKIKDNTKNNQINHKVSWKRHQ